MNSQTPQNFACRWQQWCGVSIPIIIQMQNTPRSKWIENRIVAVFFFFFISFSLCLSWVWCEPKRRTEKKEDSYKAKERLNTAYYYTIDFVGLFLVQRRIFPLSLPCSARSKFYSNVSWDFGNFYPRDTREKEYFNELCISIDCYLRSGSSLYTGLICISFFAV